MGNEAVIPNAKYLQELKGLTGTAIDPLEDWQIAGLVFLLFRGGLMWTFPNGSGTYANEGRQNLQKYLTAAANMDGNLYPESKQYLMAYLQNVRTALDNDTAAQAAAAHAHAAMRDFMAALNKSLEWTYCGTVSARQITKIATLDSLG
jgi:hypothetical protein